MAIKSVSSSTMAAMAAVAMLSSSVSVHARMMGDGGMAGSYGTYGDMACDGTAKYSIKYDMAWSRSNHPNDYPDGAMFTPMFTFAHSADLTLWRFGETASEPVRLVAELGDGSGLEMVAETCVADGTCAGLYSPMCVAPDEGSKGVCVAEMDIDVPATYPYLSSQAMLAPSPDWFIGVDSLDLCKNGKWVDFIDYPLYPLDAGTDSGLSFMSPDLDTQPRAPITNLADIMPCTLGHFYNAAEGRTVPIGKLTVTRK